MSLVFFSQFFLQVSFPLLFFSLSNFLSFSPRREKKQLSHDEEKTYAKQTNKKIRPWVQGNYSGLLVQLSSVYSALRGDASGVKNEDASQGFVRSTTKYWVRAFPFFFSFLLFLRARKKKKKAFFEGRKKNKKIYLKKKKKKKKKKQVRTADVSAVKHHILQQLPVFQYSAEGGAGAVDAGDAQLVNSVSDLFCFFPLFFFFQVEELSKKNSLFFFPSPFSF